MRKVLNWSYLVVAALSVMATIAHDYKSAFTLFTIASLWGIELAVYERTR